METKKTTKKTAKKTETNAATTDKIISLRARNLEKRKKFTR